MKNLFILIVGVILISCTNPPKVVPEYLNISNVDFSDYAAIGFLFTPDKYGGDYQSIGLISLTYRPLAKYLPLVGNPSNNPELAIIQNTAAGLGGAATQQKSEWKIFPKKCWRKIEIGSNGKIVS